MDLHKSFTLKSFLIAYAFRVLLLGPIVFAAIIAVAAWLTLGMKGIEFSTDQLKEVLPTIFKVAMLGTAGVLINGVVREWQKYNNSRDDSH